MGSKCITCKCWPVGLSDNLTHFACRPSSYTWSKYYRLGISESQLTFTSSQYEIQWRKHEQKIVPCICKCKHKVWCISQSGAATKRGRICRVKLNVAFRGVAAGFTCKSMWLCAHTEARGRRLWLFGQGFKLYRREECENHNRNNYS